MSTLRKVEESDSSPIVLGTKPSSGSILHLGNPVRVTSRLAIWGTFAGVATALATPLIGGGLIGWFAGGAGAIVGGLGTVGLSALILRRPRARLAWKAAAMMGIPFGLYLGAVGLLAISAT